MASCSPSAAFKNVDLPTFGRPTMAAVPLRCSGTGLGVFFTERFRRLDDPRQAPQATLEFDGLGRFVLSFQPLEQGRIAMSIAWVTRFGSMLLGAGVLVVACGGDDSSSGGSGGAGGSATTAGSGGSGTAGSATSGPTGSSGSTGTGGATGSGGSRGSGGAGGTAGGMCPAMQPPAGESCNVDHTCTYGSASCDCVAGLWTCTGGGTDGGNAGCPADIPDPGGDCTMEGKVCIYDGGHTVCTCSVMDGWQCLSMRRGSP
jgi:hypothetical protein